MQDCTKVRASAVGVDQRNDLCNVDSLQAAPRCPLGQACAITHQRNCKSSESAGIHTDLAGLGQIP